MTAAVLKKTSDKAKHRLDQIGGIIAKLYEDKVSGEITPDMFPTDST